MKILHEQEYKYFFREEDKKQVEEALNFIRNKDWLAGQLGITYKSLWEKLSPNKMNYFSHMEILTIEKVLNIELKRG